MLTFLEICGLCLLLLYKFKEQVFQFLDYLGRQLFQSSNWKIENVSDLCNESLHVGEIIKVKVKFIGEEHKFQQNLANLRTEIKQNFQSIVHLKEVSEEDKLVVLKFSVQKSVLCRVEIYDNNQLITALNVIFLPGPPDSEKITLVKPCPLVQCTTFIDKCIYIQPRDKFENPCRAIDVDLSRFEFHAFVADNSLENSETLPLCTKSFTYPSKYSNDLLLKTNFNYPGIFNGHITYNERVIGYGTFGIVCLSNAEESSLQHILANSPAWKYHVGHLLALDNLITKNKKIYIYVSQKQIYVQEYILKFIPIRIATFRVSSMTKMELLFADNDQNKYTFSIADGIQPKVTIEMDKSSTRLVFAMFAHFLQKRFGGSETFTAKQQFFYNELCEIRNASGLRISFMTLKISRDDIINSTQSNTYYYNTKDWCKNFKIEFTGEEGLDGGGLRREWLDLICHQLFASDKSGLFSTLGNSRLVHPNPTSTRNSSLTKKHYQLAGKIVGKCLFESAVGDSYKTMVNGKFTRSFLAQILGLRPNYKHFEQDDPDLFMSKIKFILENDVDKMEMTFSDEEYNLRNELVKTVDLVPNGSTKFVTNDNKEDYLNALANYRLGTRVQKEVEAFCKGLHEIVPYELLMNFDENELELLMCGKSEFSVDDLKKNFSQSFTIGFDSAYKRVLEWFWIAIANMTSDEKAKLLQFITGSSLLPHGGFANLVPRLRVIMQPTFGKLPTAQTCANQICLSDNDSFESFEKCLRLAINEGSQGFGFK